MKVKAGGATEDECVAGPVVTRALAKKSDKVNPLIKRICPVLTRLRLAPVYYIKEVSTVFVQIALLKPLADFIVKIVHIFDCCLLIC